MTLLPSLSVSEVQNHSVLQKRVKLYLTPKVVEVDGTI